MTKKIKTIKEFVSDNKRQADESFDWEAEICVVIAKEVKAMKL